MGGSEAQLSIVIKLRDEATAAMQGVAASFKTAGEAVVGFGEKMVTMGETVQRAGQKMSIGLTVPLVAFGLAATKNASDFEDAMLKIQTGAGASAQEVSQLSKTFLDMAENGAQQTPLQLAQGMYYVESAGFHAADAMTVLKAAMDGANVSGVDLNTVSQQLVTVMNATHAPVSEAANTMTLLNAMVGQGVMTMQDLIGALSTGIIPKAQTLGVGLKDVAATLDAFTRSGTPATDAATRMGMAMELAASPSPKAVKALESMGLTQYQLADDMRNKGIIPALQDLETHLQTLGQHQQTDAIKELFGGARTAGGVEQMLQNLNQVKDAFDGLSGSAQNFTGYVQAQGETTAAYFNRMKAAASASSIEIGNAMAPLEAQVFPMLAKAIEAVTNWFTNLSPGMQKTIIAGLGLLAVLGPTLIVLGSLITAVGTMITIIGGLITAFTVVAAVVGVSGGLIILALAAVGVAVYLLITHWQDLKNLVGSVLDWFGSKIDWLLGKIRAIADAMGTVIHGITSVGGSIGNGISGLFSGVVKAFASGGIVNGPTLAMVGEAGPEAIIPLSAFQGGAGLAGGGGFGGGLVININGGYYLDQQASRQFADLIAKTVGQQLKLRSI